MPRFRLSEWIRWSCTHMMMAREPGPYLSDEQIERLIRDLDASLRDIELLTRPHAGPSVLMHDRLRHLGLDPGDIAETHALIFSELEDTCQRCAQWRRCARDLVRPGGIKDVADFCPNSARFDRLMKTLHDDARPAG